MFEGYGGPTCGPGQAAEAVTDAGVQVRNSRFSVNGGRLISCFLPPSESETARRPGPYLFEMEAHHTDTANSQIKEGENEASSAETSLSVEDSAQHGRPAEVEAASDLSVLPAEELQTVLAQKIAKMEVKKSEDRDDEKHLTKLLKKSTKDLKEQLAQMGIDEKVAFLHERFCEKVNEFNRLERSNEKLQRQYDTLQREVDAASQEMTRTKSIKTKLEALCKQVVSSLQVSRSTLSLLLFYLASYKSKTSKPRKTTKKLLRKIKKSTRNKKRSLTRLSRCSLCFISIQRMKAMSV